MPSQSAMRMSGDQFRLPSAPARVSLAARRAAQSATRAGLSAGLGMTASVEHWAVNWGAMGMGVAAAQIGRPSRAIWALPKGARRDAGMQPVKWLPSRCSSVR